MRKPVPLGYGEVQMYVKRSPELLKFELSIFFNGLVFDLVGTSFRWANCYPGWGVGAGND